MCENAKETAAPPAEEPASPTGGDAGSSLPRPANHEAWQKSTDLNMMNSRNYVRDMLSRLRQNEIEDAANKAAAEELVKVKQMEAKNAVMARAEKHTKVIDTSFQCMQGIDDAKLQMDDVYVKLKHQRMQGFAALQVCERRIQLREKRPPQEFYNDTVGEALVAEKKKLEAARSELLGLEEESKKLNMQLCDMRRFLSSDMGERRLEMAHDFSSLKVKVAPPPKGGTQAAGAEGGEASPEAGGEVAPAPMPPVEAAPPAAEEKKAGDAAPAEGAPPAEEAGGGGGKAAPDPKKLIGETEGLLGQCQALRQKAFDRIERIKVDSREALSKVEYLFQRRCKDLAQKKKDLEMHALDVEAAMVTAERALERLRKQVDPRDKRRFERLQNDEKALQLLKDSRQQLAEDIRNKFAALEIDNLCRRTTPAKADSAKRQQPAAGGLQRTASAPLLKKKDNGMGNSMRSDADSFDAQSTRASTTATGTTAAKPPSPAGGSSALRAAAKQSLGG